MGGASYNHHEYDRASWLTNAEPLLWKLTLIFILATGALLYFRPLQQAAADIGESNLVLRASDENSRLRLRWDPALRSVRNAESGKMEVLDGGSRFEFPLVRDTLLSGSFEYARRSDDVVATLRLYEKGRESKYAVMRSFGEPVAIQTPPGPKRRVLEQVRNRTIESRKTKPVSGKAKSKSRRRSGR